MRPLLSPFLLVLLAFAGFLLPAPVLVAREGGISASEIYRESQVNDLAASRRLVAGGNEILRWTFLLLKIVAVATVAWGVIQAFNGSVTRMLGSFMIALVLFFVPQIVDLAEGLAHWANTV